MCLCIAFASTFPATSYAQQSFLKNVETSLTYTVDVFSNVKGGLNTGTRYLDNIDADLSFELGDWSRIKGLSFYFYALNNLGSSISELTGDIQTINNIETENSFRLYEAWFEKTFPKLRSSLLFGLYDLNSEFDVNRTGLLFINSSHGIGPEYSSSGILGPSIFPYTSLALRLKTIPFPGFSIKAIVLDGVPSNPNNTVGTHILFGDNDGTLTNIEFVITDPNKNDDQSLNRGIHESRSYRLVVGAWRYSEERIGWKGVPEKDQGIYVLGEKTVYHEKSDPDQGLSVFARIGIANSEINQFNSYLGYGIAYTGLLPNRDTDEFGIGIATAFTSSEFRLVQNALNQNFSSNESIVEVTYLLNAFDRISFQLDSQYIINPNTAPGIDNAWAFGIRTRLSF